VGAGSLCNEGRFLFCARLAVARRLNYPFRRGPCGRLNLGRTTFAILTELVAVPIVVVFVVLIGGINKADLHPTLRLHGGGVVHGENHVPAVLREIFTRYAQAGGQIANSAIEAISHADARLCENEDQQLPIQRALGFLRHCHTISSLDVRIRESSQQATLAKMPMVDELYI
jgi:hypothetical protein